jgi:hypothetical protein
MSRWKAQDRTVCIRGTVVCGQAEDDAECGIIVDAHNADIAALEAERDEWKRRCEKIVESLKPDGPPIPGGMFDKEVRVLWRAGIELHTNALAIAEGRDNG